MKYLAVPVPLFSSEMNVIAYSFKFQSGDNALFNQNKYLDNAFDSPLLELIDEIGIEALTGGQLIFVPVSHVSLLLNLEERCATEPRKIVFVLGKDFDMSDTYLERVERLRTLGYGFAVNSKIDWHYHAGLLKMCDYAFIDSKSSDPQKVRKYLKGLNRRINIVLDEIEHARAFRDVRYEGYELFEGPFYRLPLSMGQSTVNPLKSNYIQLLKITQDQNFEFESVAKVVMQDTALAISLLKLVNSLGLSQKIKSIKHAAAILGQKELVKWITTAVTKMLSADKPSEITKLSLIRAKFAENLAPSFEMAIVSESLFLTGLFSVLNVILDMPMITALSAVQVADNIKEALLFHRGEHYKPLEFIIHYEMADWVAISRFMIIYGIDTDVVFKAYFDALLWYSGLITMIDDPEYDLEQ